MAGTAPSLENIGTPQLYCTTVWGPSPSPSQNFPDSACLQRAGTRLVSNGANRRPVLSAAVGLSGLYKQERSHPVQEVTV